MPLPPSAPRQQLHTRNVVYTGWHRDDGLWDIEAQLTDTKTYPTEMAERGMLPPGEPIHGLAIRVTVDDSFTIRDIATSMDHTPFGECQQGTAPMQQMIGATLGPGWRQSIERALGGVRGCTHLRELLFNMATAAYQTIPAWRERMRRDAGTDKAPMDKPPYHVGRCIAWDVDGAVVQRHYPQFAGWEPLRRKG